MATAVSGPVQPPTLRRLCGLCREAEPESETQGKPATRPGVFEEPWDASWLWFAISESKPRRAQSEVVCKSVSVDTARSAIAGASETLLAELCISKERSASPS